MLKDNWLNTVSSATYKFTFYITDSDVWNDPFEWLSPTDDKALNAGKAIIIAEDGVEGAFNVQNVNISAAAASVSNGHATANEIQFDLNETLGFSFLDKSLAAAKMFGKNTGAGVNFASQLFVLKLDFIGRDPETGATVTYPDPFIYSMKCSKVNGSLGPAGAQYFMIMAPIEKIGQQESVTSDTITITDITTVGDFGKRLEEALNQNQIDKQRAAIADNPHTDGPTTPLTEWRVIFDPSTTVQAIDTRQIPGFNLFRAEWAGTDSESEADGRSQSLENEVRQQTINPETQITSWIAESLSANVPSFAEYNVELADKGITFTVEVEQTTTMTGIMHSYYGQEIKSIELRIKLRRDDTATPLDESSIIALRNRSEVQEERFQSQILPSLAKKYSYQYTGENTEVEAVDISIHNGFYNAISPGVGTYYTDESFQFESNADTNTGTFVWESPSANPQPENQIASVKYLSDINLDKINVNRSQIFDHQLLSATGQQTNESTQGSKIAAAALAAHAARLIDNQTMKIEAKGDPIFLGTNGKNFFNTQSDSTYLAFLNFVPDPVDLLELQRRGPVDMITTGIYKITYIHSKFSQGKFTQTIDCYRDPNSNPLLLLDAIVRLEVE
jgi:hypothetical protein